MTTAPAQTSSGCAPRSISTTTPTWRTPPPSAACWRRSTRARRGRRSGPGPRARRRRRPCRLLRHRDRARAGRVRVLGGEARDRPAVISPFALAKIGPGAARRYFMTGEPFDAAEALRIGLVHEVVSDLDAALDRVLAELRSAGRAQPERRSASCSSGRTGRRQRDASPSGGRARKVRKACARSSSAACRAGRVAKATRSRGTAAAEGGRLQGFARPAQVRA